MNNKAISITTETISVSNDKAAELLDIKSASLDKDRRVGHLGIPYIKAGRRVLYSLNDLNEWIKANRQQNSEKGEHHA